MAAEPEAGPIRAHVKRYQEDPRAGHDWNPYGTPMPCLLLTATGRRSGKSRTLALVYGQDGEAFIIVGSRGGTATNPKWYDNLVASPHCEIQVAHDHFKVRARTAQGAERQRLWELMVGVLPRYADYQARTAREIPVVVLEPRP
jgi:deazaflavin-dependent oxidoreductase (nitroreductase family)